MGRVEKHTTQQKNVFLFAWGGGPRWRSRRNDSYFVISKLMFAPAATFCPAAGYCRTIVPAEIGTSGKIVETGSSSTVPSENPACCNSHFASAKGRPINRGMMYH